ncbi:hypothetical protein ACFL1S_06095 [Pseudomonadota bacterium]
MRSRKRTRAKWLKVLGTLATALYLPGVVVAQTGNDHTVHWGY